MGSDKKLTGKLKAMKAVIGSKADRDSQHSPHQGRVMRNLRKRMRKER